MPTDDLFGHLLWSASFSACLDMLIRAISRSGSPGITWSGGLKSLVLGYVHTIKPDTNALVHIV